MNSALKKFSTNFLFLKSEWIKTKYNPHNLIFSFTVSFSATTTTRSLNVPEAPRSIPKLKLKNSQNNPISISTIPKFGNNKSQTNPISTDGQKLRNKIEEILFKHQQKTAAAAAKKKTENNNQQENNSSHKKAGNSNEDNEDEDAQPFTVVRVSSSVSQVIT